LSFVFLHKSFFADNILSSTHSSNNCINKYLPVYKIVIETTNNCKQVTPVEEKEEGDKEKEGKENMKKHKSKECGSIR